jgi:hypothetical protein
LGLLLEGDGMLVLRPTTIKEANRVVGLWHRHNRPVHGALFAVGVEREGALVGVAIVGRPIGRNAQDGVTCEIVRVATDGTYNACSMLYGACCRAAKALGYRKVLTKTLVSEPGSSLKASGFQEDGSIKAGLDWDRKGRRRVQVDLFGEETMPSEAKRRWTRSL